MARRSVVIDIEFRNRQAKQALKGVESGLTDVRVAADKANKGARSSSNALGSGFGKASTKVKGTNQAVVNLSRIIQDAPFGTVGVQNNIEPFIGSFQRMGDGALSTGEKVTTLLTEAFTGPGALITIVSLVTSALTVISLGIVDLGDDAEDTTKELEAVLEAAKALEGVLNEGLSLAGKTDKEIKNYEKALELVKERAEIEKDISLQSISIGSGSTSSQDREIKALEGKVKAINTAISSLGIEDADDLGITDIQDKLSELGLSLEYLSGRAGGAEQKMAAFVDQLDADAQQAIQRYNAGLNGGTLAINQQIATVQGQIQAYKDLANETGQNTAPAIKKLQGVLEDLQGVFDDGGDDEKGGNPKAVFYGLSDIIKDNETKINQLINKVPKLTDKEKEQLEVLKAQNKQLQARLDYRNNPHPSAPISDPIGDGAVDANITFGGGGLQPVEGSIAALKLQMQQLQQLYEMTPFNDTRLALTQQIKDLRAEIERLKGPLKDVGDTGNKSLEVLQRGAAIAAEAIAQIFLRGAEAEDVIKDLAIRLASRAIITALTAAATGGASLGGGSFLKAVFSGFATGTDAGFPGIGRVGERGEELFVAPPYSTIITNDNVKRLDRMKREARTGADNISQMGVGNIVDQLRQAIIEGNRLSAPPVIQYRQFDEGLNDERNIEQAIGNDT